MPVYEFECHRCGDTVTLILSLADYEIRELVLAGTMGLSALLFIYMIQLFKHCIREPSK